MDDFRALFQEEAAEYLQSLEAALLRLESEPGNRDALDEAYRVLHTLKGTGQMFGFDALGAFAHELEDVFQSMRNGNLPIAKPTMNVGFAGLDVLRAMMGEHAESPATTAKADSVRQQIDALMSEVTDTAADDPAPEPQTLETTDSASTATDTPTTKDWYLAIGPLQNDGGIETDTDTFLRELAALGQMQSVRHVLKTETEQSAEALEVMLRTESQTQDIRNVCVFVVDDDALYLTALDAPLTNLEEAKTALAQANIAQQTDWDAHKSVDFASRLQLLEPLQQPQTASAVLVEQATQDVNEETTGLPSAQQTRIRVGIEKLDSQLNLVSELISMQARLNTLTKELDHPELLAAIESHGKLVQNLRDNAHDMRLVPINSLFQRAQRVVRDLSQSLDKPVHFKTIGGDTELDLAMLERLTDPMLHLLRNAMDHGLESPEERRAAGKPETGTIQLIAQQVGNEVQLHLEDDGRGLDPERLWQKGLEKGLVSKPNPPSQSAAFDLIFNTGFSTAKSVTGVSGRGMGMDVVRRSIRDLNGNIQLYSVPGQSTAFTLLLPLTLSIMEGFLVQVADTDVILPLQQVERCYSVAQSELQHSLTRQVTLDGDRVTFIDLAAAFPQQNHNPPAERQAVVVQYHNQRLAIIVDTMTGNQQVVLKSPGAVLRENPLLSGFSLLGNGQPAVVLDTVRVIEQLLDTETIEATE